MKNADWMREFQIRAGERLREIFDRDLQPTPPDLVKKLEKLRQLEVKLLKGKRR